MKYEIPQLDLILTAEDTIMGSFEAKGTIASLWDMLVDPASN